MEINVTGKDGALTKFEIIGDYEVALDIVKSVTTYPATKTEIGLVGKGSKSDIRKIFNKVEARAIAAKAPEAKSANSCTGGRYVELLSVAVARNLQHGREWVCSEIDIETKGANPSYEGELICYVYNN